MWRKVFLVLLVAAAGGAVYVARRRAQESGRTILEVLPELPAEAQRLVDQGIERLKSAVELGRQAALERQREIQELIEGASDTSGLTR